MINIHDVSNKEQNRAMKEIDNFKGPGNELLKEWAYSKCKKIIYLIMGNKKGAWRIRGWSIFPLLLEEGGWQSV